MGTAILKTKIQPSILPAKPPRTWRHPAQHLHAAMNAPWYGLVLDLQDAVTRATVNFFSTRGLRAAHLPITTSSISSPMGLGSDSLPVAIELHGERVYLADSMQFLLEYATRLAARGAYYIMPSFRGECHDTTHLNEFFHSEAELRGNLTDVLDTVDAYMTALSGALLEVAALTQTLQQRTRHLQTFASGGRAPRLTFDEVAVMLADIPDAIAHDPAGCRTLTRSGERALTLQMGGAAWVTEWDAIATPFYQATVERQGGLRSLNADLVLSGPGEVVGAGQRHTTATEVLGALHLRGIDPQPYGWYLQMKHEAPLATAGFGLGVERLLCWALGHDDIRDLQLVPRLLGIPRAF
ncbi:amino acid--tRNA ligase-related protein [Rhizobium ruizarguesonis]|uniref:amino acid--tRNA ligase-related protein n=1 Tax=Rhizobium ruizarguesonis TaxID=2081791 RepID=UPI0013E0E98A|nr:amino acid--tRNA ligase-related protein [Rhizobium ruizarguesonis]NEI79072.1 asparagine ligase A [Rhizobium ruizarguesonis]